MVQLQPSLALTMKNLAPMGCIISTEQQAAIDFSLPIKRVEAGLRTLVLWGKITALNGKDYLIAEGTTQASVAGTYVHWEMKYCYSQEGVKWIDLMAITPDIAEKANRVKTPLSGDSSKTYEVALSEGSTPVIPEEGEDAEAAKKLVSIVMVPELAVLRARVNAIDASTGVVPAGSLCTDAVNRVVGNALYGGSKFPDKLESYVHRTSLPGTTSLAQDLRGSWSVHFDPFKSIAVVRSFLYPGYFFYFKSDELTWGSMYVGTGTRNDDLIFML